jgi:hypothetical protein
MYQTPEQLIALNKSNLDAAMRFAGVALQSVEKLVGLQMETAKAPSPTAPTVYAP